MFLKPSHKNVNTVIRLVSPVYDMEMHIFKVTIIIKQAKCENNTGGSPDTVFFSPDQERLMALRVEYAGGGENEIWYSIHIWPVL